MSTILAQLFYKYKVFEKRTGSTKGFVNFREILLQEQGAYF